MIQEIKIYYSDFQTYPRLAYRFDAALADGSLRAMHKANFVLIFCTNAVAEYLYASPKKIKL